LKSRLESIGVHLPARIQSTKELTSQVRYKSLLDVERLTGIANRRVRAETDDSLTLAVSAARACLKNSKYSPADLDVIIYAGIFKLLGRSKHIYEPAMSALVKKELGSNAKLYFDVSNACTGMLTAVYILDSLIRTGFVKNGLIVSGEPNSVVIDQAVKEIDGRCDQQYASLTLGDAGAAAIMDASTDAAEGISLAQFYTFAEFSDLCTVTPSDRNAGWALYTDMVKLQFETLKRSAAAIKYSYAGENVDFNSDFDFVIPHQTSVKGIQTGMMMHLVPDVVHKLPEVLYSVQEFGNTSSTTHFVALNNALKEGKVKRGHRLMLLGYGSGINIGLVDLTVGSLQV
jgi:3-oxoacyl-[acyl-carrier-protein] synthase III